MEIKDNTFSRQFETSVNGSMISVEYSFQEKKIFLTRLNVPENFDDEEFISDLLKNIMAIAIERKLRMISTGGGAEGNVVKSPSLIWGMVQRQHVSLWKTKSWFESRFPS